MAISHALKETIGKYKGGILLIIHEVIDTIAREAFVRLPVSQAGFLVPSFLSVL